MGLFSALANRRARDSTNGSGYPFRLGMPSTSGKRVDERTAMQVTAVYACVRILAESISTLPLHLYKADGEGGRHKAHDNHLYFLLNSEPNKEMTSQIMLEVMMTHLLLWGNSYVQVIRNAKNEVIELYPLMPDRMKVDRDENRNIYYEYTIQQSDPKSMDKKEITYRLKPEDVLHVPALGFDGLIGYSPIAMARNAIGLGISAEEYGSKLFKNGAAPAGILNYPRTLNNTDNIRDSWMATFGGSGNANKVAVLEEGVTFTPISINPEDAQFLQTRRYQMEEIARMFRVPLHLLGDLEHATFSNVENLTLDFVKFTLTPWLNRIEKSLNRRLLSDEEKESYYFEFNADGILRGDYESRQRGFALARQNGWLNMNEIRAYDNLPPVPEEEGGNAYLVNGNMVKVKDAGAAYLKQQQSQDSKTSNAAIPRKEVKELL